MRELAHVVEAAMVLCDGDELRPEHLPARLRARPNIPSPASHVSATSLPTLEALERAHIELVLKATNGHRSQAAEILGISERNLYRKLREYQMIPADAPG